jgi:hypothetical protein
MTNEVDEMSAASRGSHGPDAWALLLPGKEKRLRLTRQEAEDHLEFWLHNHQIRSVDDGKMVPLFAVSEAEIDALEYVVVEGRMASKQDYGVLRALLVRLRPEWATSGDLGLRPEEGDLRNGSPDRREAVQ